MSKQISILTEDEKLRLKALEDAKREQQAIEERIKQASIDLQRGLYDHIKNN